MIGYFRRIFVPGKIDIGKFTTKASGLNIGSVSLTTAGVITLTSAGRLVEAVQTLNSTATAITANGVSLLGAGGSTTDKVYSLSRPSAAGITKTLIVNATGAQVIKATLAGSTTTGFFHGSTFRTIAFTSNSTKRRNALLVAPTTVTWAIVSMSTGTTLAG